MSVKPNLPKFPSNAIVETRGSFFDRLGEYFNWITVTPPLAIRRSGKAVNIYLAEGQNVCAVRTNGAKVGNLYPCVVGRLQGTALVDTPQTGWILE